jgi:hypothetical protein
LNTLPQKTAMRQRHLLAGFALVGIGGGVYLSPIASLGLLVLAAQQGDRAKMEQLADFKQLQTSINKQVKGAAEKQITSSLGGRNIFSESFTAITMLAINPMIENKVADQVSASGLATAFKELQQKTEEHGPIAGAIKTAEQLTAIRLNYKNINEAQINLQNPEAKNKENQYVKLSMQRQKLLGWRLVDVELNL